MEKFYLAKLSSGPSQEVQKSPLAKFINVRFGNVHSFGLVRLLNRTFELSSLQVEDRDLKGNKVAKYKINRTIQLDEILFKNSPVVSFDVTSSIICVEESERKFECHDCIILNELGHVYELNLTTGNFKYLFKGLSQEPSKSAGGFIECHLQQQVQEDLTKTSSKDETIHLLAERSYVVYNREFPSSAYKANESYSLSDSELASESWIQFVHVHLPFQRDIVNRLVLLELNNGTIKCIKGSLCVAQIKPDESGPAIGQRILLSGCNQDLVLITADCSFSKLSGLAIQMQSDEIKKVSDPDGLLLREPSIDMEKVWTVDLNSIGSFVFQVALRDSKDDEKYIAGCMSAIWLRSKTADWPECFVVIRDQNLLVFSFKQRSSNPFATVYDRSFFGLPIGSREDNVYQLEDHLLDPKIKPRLIHNFKLTGTKPGDSLFNGVLLKPDSRFTAIDYSCKTELLVGFLNTGDMIAFHFDDLDNTKKTPEDATGIVETIKESTSLLMDLQNRLSIENKRLRDILKRLETSEATQQRNLNLSEFAQAELSKDRHNEPVCQYNLIIQISTLSQVTKILIVSTVCSHLMKPALVSIAGSILNAQVYNGSPIDSPMVLANIQLEKLTKIGELDIDPNSSQYREEPVQSWAMVELESPQSDYVEEIKIQVSMFIIDGQVGQIKVYYMSGDGVTAITGSDVNQNSNMDLSEMSQVESVSSYHSSSFTIKPLLSYGPTNEQSQSDTSGSVVVLDIEDIERDVLTNWISHLIDLDDNNRDEASKTNVELYSSFTGCFIKFQMRPDRCYISSTDVIALDMIRRHIMKRATESSIQLKISPFMVTERNLRYLLEKQFLNYKKLKSIKCCQSESNNKKSSSKCEILMESLMSEVQQIDLNMNSDWLEEALKFDLKQQIDSQKGKGEDLMKDETELVRVFTDILCNHLLDVLIDYNRLTGIKVTSSWIESKRRQLLDVLSTLNHMGEDQIKDKTLFVEKVLDILHGRADLLITS